MMSKFSNNKKPSVTELTGLLDKPALLNWANKQGLQGIDITESRKKYLKDGSSIHDQIEQYHLNGTPFLIPENESNYLKFIEGKEIVSVEHKIETQWFTGRVDAIISIDGITYIIDYKSNQRGVYLENKLQLVGYSMSVKCDKFAIVSVPDFTLIEVDISDRRPYEEILKGLSHIYKYKQLL